MVRDRRREGEESVVEWGVKGGGERGMKWCEFCLFNVGPTCINLKYKNICKPNQNVLENKIETIMPVIFKLL